MRKLISIIAILFGYAGASWGGAPPGPLTSISAISTLSNAQANQALPVAFEATVTYYPGYNNLLFVQDGRWAVFVFADTSLKLLPGDRVLVRGTTQSSFRPIVVSNSITVLRHGTLPKPVTANFDELIRTQLDCMRVTVHGVIRTAELGWSPSNHVTYIQILMDGGYIEAIVDSTDEAALKSLLDAEVEVTGIAGGRFDNKMQLSGIILHVSSLAGIKLLKRGGASQSSIPVTPMDKILSYYHVQDRSQRIRVRGTITYYQPGTAVVLQEGAKSIWVATPARGPLRIGDIADATGFPDLYNGFLVLNHGEIEDSHQWAPVTPQAASLQQLGYWSANRPDGRLYDLVSIEGQVVAEVRGATRDEYVLAADGRLFSAIYGHPDAASQVPLAAMKNLPLGSRVRVTGICILEGANPYNTSEEVPFRIQLRTFDDIVVVAAPPLVNTRNLLLALGVLLLLVFAVLGRGWALEHKVRHQTAVLAAVEQQRSRILEDINGSRPLAEILEKIVGMVSSMLDGAPCWCEVADGATVGKCPREPHNLEIVRVKIEARSGALLGTMLAAFAPRTPVTSRRTEMLADGVRLATLGIETRRLYTDLRRRSEFDLLTDVHNRFSLERRLDEQIAVARENAGVFGLIYIDLDKFKQINDLYGHRVGDLYLHGVAGRMKQQLRADDLLARLGGDEFVALLPTIRNRVGVEEITQRLELCFNEPFTIEGHLIQGTASFGIALYPQDGASRDELLNAADTAMYAVKNLRRHKAQSEAESPAIPV
jgi:diguanylate cyclase (GGDEF)-like protein